MALMIFSVKLIVLGWLILHAAYMVFTHYTWQKKLVHVVSRMTKHRPNILPHMILHVICMDFYFRLFTIVKLIV
jgi:hypothetical protein